MATENWVYIGTGNGLLPDGTKPLPKLRLIYHLWCLVTFPEMLKTSILDMSLKSTYLTLKHREKHGCVVSTVATDALVLKHQAISIHNAD